MTSFLSAERIATQALQEHTTHAIRILSEHYGFDADEALTKVDLAPRPLPSLVGPADDPVLVIARQAALWNKIHFSIRMHRHPMSCQSNWECAEAVHATDKPSKKQMAANQKMLGARKEALQRRIAAKKYKEAQKTAVNIMKGPSKP